MIRVPPLCDVDVLTAVLLGIGALIGNTAAAQNEERYGGTLNYAENETAATLNPYQRTEARGVTDRLYTLLYSRLVTYDHQRGGLRPGLAKEWSASGSEAVRRITFKLRDGVRWHDGESFTPSDVEFTYRYAVNAGSNDEARANLEIVESVETDLEENTVTFKFEQKVTDPAKRIFASIWIIPEHRFDRNLLPKDEELGSEPVGTGPYKFVDQKLDGSIDLEAFPEYWGGTGPGGRPYIETTKMRVFQDPVTMVSATIANNIDLLVETPPDQIAKLQQRPQILLESYQSLSFDGFAYNTDSLILGNTKVRQAFTRALDREEMLTNWYAGKGSVIEGPVVPGSAYYNPDLEGLSHDPERARQILEKMEYVDRNGDGIRETPDGKELSFRLVTLKAGAATSTAKQSVAETYKDALGEIGVEITVDNQVKENYKQTVFENGKFEIAWIRWEFDPNYNFWGHFRSNGSENVVNYENTKIDTLFQKFNSANDPQRRREYAQSAQRIISRDVPYTFLYTLQNYASINRSVIPTRIDPYYFFSYYDNWYMDPELR